MATITRKVATEEDLLAMPRDGHKYELVDGEIRASPTGNRRGEVVSSSHAAWATSSAATPAFAFPARTSAVRM